MIKLRLMKQKYAYLIIIISTLFSIQSHAATNNYYGTTGDMYGNFWNTVDNTYTSAMDVTGGAILNFNTATTTAIGPSSSITIAGINVNANVTIGTVGSGTVTNLSNGNVIVDVGSGYTFDASTQTFTGNVAASYTKSGAGVFATNGNSYSGGFTLNAGTLVMRGSNAMGNGTLTINGGTIATTTTRDLTGKYTSIVIGGDFTLAATTGLASGGSYLTFSAPTALGTATRAITIGGTGNYYLNGVISETSTAGITVNTSSTGILILGGANTYTGVTTINSGVQLWVSNAAALGTVAGNTIVNSGATLNLNGINYTTLEPLTLNGTGVGGSGAINNSSASAATFAGPITLGSSTMIGSGTGTVALTSATAISGTGNLTISGTYGGSITSPIAITGDLIKSNTGSWVISSNSNSYTGATTVNAGSLCFGASEVIPNGSLVTLNSGTLCTGVTVGYSETLSQLDLNANSTIALGTGSHNLIFANSSAQAWGAFTLTITGWNGTSAGRVYVGSDASGLTAGQLALITFSGYAAGAAINAATGEITPAGGVAAPTLTADNTLNTVDNNIDITFSDSPVWRAAVTAVNIQISNTPTYTTLSAGTDYDLTAGNLKLKPSGGNALLNTTTAINGLAGGVKPIVIIATGYSNNTISQTIDNGVATQLSMNTQPAAPASNGAVLATQPIVKTLDQYGNGAPSSASITAAIGAGVWEIGGTLTQAASGRLTTFTDLVAYSDAAVTGATISFTTTGLTSVTSGTFNIPVPTASPALTAAVGATVDGAFDVTFTDVPAWRSAIRRITVGGTTLAAGAYNATVAGKVTFTPSVSTLLQSNGTKTIIIYSTGYSSATVSQDIAVGVVSASTSTAAIDANLSGGATRTITCTAKDQYSNLVSGYVFKYDVSITNSNVTTAESYTVDGNARTSTTNDLSLGVTNGSGVKTFTVAMPVTIDSGDGIAIQIQLNNGSTNVGSDFGNVLVAQTITFGALANKVNGEAPFTLTATASSGLAVSYSSSDTNVATVSGTTVTIVGVGTTTITASQAGDGSYTAATSVPQGLSVTTTPHYTITAATNISSLTTSSTSDITVSSNTLTINSNKLIRDLIVESSGKVVFSGAYALSTVGNVILKADKNSASFSLNLGSGSLAITGTGKFLKTMDDTKWYFMSFPCNIAVNDITFTGGYSYALGTDYFIKYYDGDSRIQNLGATSNWKNVTAGFTLNAGDGYIVGLVTGIGGDREMIFPLANANIQSEPARTVSVTAHGEGITTNTLGNTVGANHKGWNLVGQPYISKLAGTGVGVNYMTLYDGSVYTTYANTDVTSIDPFTSFFVQADAALQASTVTFSLASRQSLPSSVRNDTIDRIRLYFTTPTGVDNTNLVLGDKQTTDYQIGQDMEKWITRGTDKPQVYTLLNGINYAFNALPIASIQNLPLGIYTNAIGNASISTDAQSAPNLTQLLLTDTSNGTTTDLLTSNYNFNAAAGTNNGRFLLSAQRAFTELPKISSDQPYCLVIASKLLINSLKSKSRVLVYDAFGRFVASELANSTSIEIALPSKGVYIVQIIDATTTTCQKVICR